MRRRRHRRPPNLLRRRDGFVNAWAPPPCGVAKPAPPEAVRAAARPFPVRQQRCPRQPERGAALGALDGDGWSDDDGGDDDDEVEAPAEADGDAERG